MQVQLIPRRSCESVMSHELNRGSVSASDDVKKKLQWSDSIVTMAIGGEESLLCSWLLPPIAQGGGTFHLFYTHGVAFCHIRQ